MWLQADVAFPKQESPVGNDWYEDPLSGRLHPKLMVSVAFPKDFTYIVYCKSQNCSAVRCFCRSNNLKCTGACACFDGICHNPYSLTDSDQADSD